MPAAAKKQHLKTTEKRYLRKNGLRERYGDICEKTLDRWRKNGRIPEPDFYQGPIPFWNQERLEEADRKAAKEWRSKA
jgi:hypothetical protein